MAKREIKKRRIRRSWLVAALAMAFFPACQGGSSSSFQVKATSTSTWNGPQAGPVQPFKEQQFQYRTPLEVGDGGRYLHLPYDEWRDINGRDEIPVRKVKTWWVRKLPANAQKKLEYRSGGRVLQYNAVGKLSGGSRMTVIYLHGRGGNLEWGFDDERFGGNFNRLKNMMIATGGAYLSPDFTDFDGTGFADVKALIAEYRPRTNGPLVVACGSLGNSHCWRIFHDPQTAGQVDGVIVMAGFPDNRLLSSGRAIPLLMAHGSWDPDYDYKPMVEFYRQLRKSRPDFPVRFLLFETGTHGAPIRMIDWRDTLNWIDAR